MISPFLNLEANPRYQAIAARGHAAGVWKTTCLYLELRKAAAAHADKPAIIDSNGQVLTYDELLAAADGFAGFLGERGARRGDRVAVQIPNSSAFAVALLGANGLGAATAAIDASYRGVDLDHILDLARPKVAVAKRHFRGFDYRQRYAAVQTLHPDLTVIDFGDALPVAGPRVEEWGDASSEDRLSILCFSSGTEAVPKAVAHTERTWMACADNVVAALGLGPDDVFFCAAPFSHSIGLLALYIGLTLGATIVAHDIWDKQLAYQRLCRYGCTFAWGPPTMLFDLVDQAAANGPPGKLRVFQCGGANISPALRRSAEETLGCKLSCIYGSTEVLIATRTKLDDPPELRHRTDGVAERGVEVAIWSEEGQVAPAGVAGEIVTRGLSDFLGYLGNPALNQEYITSDGWCRSGDLGTLDEDGYLRLVGRKKDIVIRGGFNINVRQVEEALEGYPGFLESAVVGVPDERLGERCCLCAVLEPGATATLSEINEFLLAQGVDKLKLPESIAVVDRLPRTASGKIAKGALRDRVAQ